MPPDRLTIERARPGMRVVCVGMPAHPGAKITNGATYTVADFDGDGMVQLAEVAGEWFFCERFIPADPPAPALTPGLIEALRKWHACSDEAACRDWLSPIGYALRAAIKAAGILDKPAPSQPFHLTPQQFQEMHNAG